jgi:hypothetical protein
MVNGEWATKRMQCGLRGWITQTWTQCPAGLLKTVIGDEHDKWSAGTP